MPNYQHMLTLPKDAYADIWSQVPTEIVLARQRSNEGATEESRCNCTALRKATRRISQLYDVVLAPSGLKNTQRSILAQVSRCGPTTVGALAETLVMDAGALAHTLKPLKREGLIAIAADPNDRRSRLVSLTGAGKARLAETDELWERAQTSFDAAFGPGKSKALRETMGMLISDAFMARFEDSLVVSDNRTRGRSRPRQ
jgi:DNA-binding MarR family transcriptional regulator